MDNLTKDQLLALQKELIRQELDKRESLKDYSIYSKKYIKIVDKQGQSVAFEMNSIQKRINETIEQLKAQGKPVRIIILKARQEGVSTLIQSRILFKTATTKNRTALIVAHTDASTNSIFNKAKFSYNNLPDDIKPLQKASNAQELIFDKPSHYKGNEEGLNSKIKIATAGGDSIGRGDTYFDVHLSEFAFFPSSPKTTLAGILQAVPKTSDTLVVIESTANGFNDFKDLWDSAMNGENDFTPLFFAWHDMEEYQMPVCGHEWKEITNTLSEYEKNLMDNYNLTPEQIKWYRWTLKNDCQGDTNMMRQENPSFPEEAFLMTGRPVFDNEKVMQRLEKLRSLYKQNKPKQGYFIFEWKNPASRDSIKDDSIKFVESTNGYINIYQDSKKNVPYVIGGDTKGDGKDKFAGIVINNTTGERVACLHGDISPDIYTYQMYCMGKYFNEALIGIEINFDLYPIKELERLRYYRQYRRRKYDTVGNHSQNKFGWKTDGNTRPLIINKLAVLVRENIELFNDIDTLEEMLTFVYDDKGRPDAMSGKHDDCIIADAIANEIRSQQAFNIHTQQKQSSDNQYSFQSEPENNLWEGNVSDKSFDAWLNY